MRAPTQRKTDTQLALSFEPSIVENHASLRAYIAHRVHAQRDPAKTIAANMDLSPSMLSRKLNPGEGDTQRFNVDDLESYIRATGDTTAIDYLATKYLQSNESRRTRLLTRLEALGTEMERSLREIKAIK